MTPKQIEDFSEAEIQRARDKVAFFFIENAKKVRRSHDYGAHVTEEEKETIMRKKVRWAQEIPAGLHDANFTVAQRIHFELTGTWMPLFPV